MSSKEQNNILDAAEDFAFYLTEDVSCGEDWEIDLSEGLKNLAVKYFDLAHGAGQDAAKWHEYFMLCLTKMTKGLPSSTTELENAVADLKHDEREAELLAGGPEMLVFPGPPGCNGSDKPPGAAPVRDPRDNGDHHKQARGRRAAKTQTEAKVEGKVPGATEVDDCDRKSVEDAEDVEDVGDKDVARLIGSLVVEIQGSVRVKISDGTRTSKFKLPNCGPVTVDVAVKVRDVEGSSTAPASTAGSDATVGKKISKEEGRAQKVRRFFRLGKSNWWVSTFLLSPLSPTLDMGTSTQYLPALLT